MPQNRLRLDFSLNSTQERLAFLDEYLPTLKFSPNQHELDTLSDYILWGKNKDGKNAQQEGIVTIKEWAPEQVESLDGLIEVPGFKETRLQALDSTQYVKKRQVFNRDKALAKASPQTRAALEELFKQIDQIDLIINYYELKIGKRKTEPRASLVGKFTEEERERCKENADKLSGRAYLQLRHRLVELRTEQYTFGDFVSPPIQLHGERPLNTNEVFSFGTDIEVRPIGLYDESAFAKKVFRYPQIPFDFSTEELEKISKWRWREYDGAQALNFEDPAHINALFDLYDDLQDDAMGDPKSVYSAAAQILKTLEFYQSIAKLTESQQEIMMMKLTHHSNGEIMEYINKKYSNSYNENYISTIYRKQIVNAIATAATLHRITMENIFYPEEFKKCKDCGGWFLKMPEFYMRQCKSNDGYSPRCKSCERIKRQGERNGKSQ